MKIILLKERPMSWNMMYAGMHWRDRAAKVQKVHWRVLEATSKITKKIDGLVDITIFAYFDKQPLDSDNIPAKLYIDGLRLKVLEDDTINFVRKVTTISLIDKENPRVEIEIQLVN